MKNLYIVIAFLLCSLIAGAQNAAVEKTLQSKYSSVQYYSDFNGWYLVSFEKSGTTYYGMCDYRGNVVVTNATKYKRHDVYIEFYLLDQEQKRIHDQWKEDMKQYEKDYNAYAKKKAEHEAKVAEYNAKCEAARSEAQGRYERARQQAIAQANAQNQYNQALNNSTTNTNSTAGIISSVLTAVGGVVNTAAAAASVKFDPIYKQVLAERGLAAPPAAPYNPKPTQPVEPADGYYWKGFPLAQPSVYTDIDFASLTGKGSYADAKKNGKYGLLDFSLKEVIPFTNSEKVKQGYLVSGYLLRVLTGGKYGVLDTNNKFVLPAIYDYITLTGEGTLQCKKNGLYGMFTQSGKQLFPCVYEEITPTNGYYKMKKGGMYGLSYMDGRDWYACRYQDIKFVNADKYKYIQAQQKSLWGLFDFNTGELILPYNFNEITTISDHGLSYFKVTKDGQFGLYNHKGTYLFPCEYDAIDLVSDKDITYIKLQQKGTVGLADENGNIIMPAGEYNSFDFIQPPFLRIKKDGKAGIFALWGELIVDCKYDNIEYDNTGNLFVGTINQAKTVVDLNGNELFKPVPDIFIMEPREDYVQIRSFYGKYGALDYTSHQICPQIFKANAIPGKILKYRKKNDLDAQNKEAIEQREQAKEDYNYRQAEAQKKRASFSFFAQNYVERIINQWQQKGEFEKTDAWRARVNQQTLSQKVYALTKNAQDEYIERQLLHMPPDNISVVGKYDPDNETFRLQSSNMPGQIMLVPVPERDAQDFRENIASAQKRPTYFIEHDSMALAEYSFTLPSGKTYKYSNQASLTYNVAQVEYNFNALTYDKNALDNFSANGKQTISSSQLTIGRSDVDVKIPVNTSEQQNTFVIIFANANYDEAPNVEYAYNDGVIFRDYCTRTLGIPIDNITFKENATLSNMKREIKHVAEIANSDVYSGNVKFIIYFTGHGLPDERSGSCYLLPSDGVVVDIENTGYKVSEMYDILAGIKAESLVILDACFSGKTKGGSALATTKGVAIKPVRGVPGGNCVVMSAGAAQETALQYTKKGHGLFTYWILKKIQASQGNVTLGQLYDYVKENVQKTALREIKKQQTPTIQYGPQAANWRNRKLK